MDWTFADIIERCSYGADVFPGDVIGSGTVGTGCFLELNGTGNLRDPDYREQWLQPGDVVELEISGQCCLSNTFVSETEASNLKSFSIAGISRLQVQRYLQHAVATRPICFPRQDNRNGLSKLNPSS